MSIYKSEKIIIRNCTFQNNTSDGYFTNKPFLGSSGGLSIGFNSSDNYFTSRGLHNILIINCIFTNNYALFLDRRKFSSTDAILNKTFYGRGGALSMLINTRNSLEFLFRDNTVINNYADAPGGGVYCLIQTYSTNQNYTFHNNDFINNTGSAAGGMAFIYQFNNSITTSSQFTIHSVVYNCMFCNNTAILEVGGAVGIFSILELTNNSFTTFKHCKFYNNTAVAYGGAVDIESYDFFVNIQTVPLVNFTNWLV